MRSDTMRLAMLPRMAVNYYEPPKPEYWDMRALRGKWYWRGLDWFLKKLGAQYRDSIPESVRVDERIIKQNDIISMVGSSKRAMEYLWGRKARATTLIVGYDEMAKLMRDAPREMLEFDAQMPIGNDREFKVAGLRVVCVPWLEGWALLPDLHDTSKS